MVIDELREKRGGSRINGRPTSSRVAALYMLIQGI